MWYFVSFTRNKVTSPLAKLSHKLTKESDYFLGQKVIEARMLGGPMDVWYKLGMIAICVAITVQLVIIYFIFQTSVLVEMK